MPTAHDEPAIHLEIYKEVFSAPAAHRATSPRVERRFVHDAVLRSRRCSRKPSACGVDLPQHQPYPRDAGAPTSRRRPTTRTPDAAEADEDAVAATFPSHLAAARRRVPPPAPAARPDRALRRPHRSGQGLRGADRVLQQLRAGRRRRDAGADGREADAAARGAVHPLRRPALGAASGCRRSKRPRSSSCPSPYESLSLLALEALAVGTPILANARSEVLVEHCVRATAACTTRTATSSSSA